MAAGVALLLALAVYLTVRRIRRAQSVVLGDGKDDHVNFAIAQTELGQRFE